MTSITAQSIEHVRETVASHARVRVRGSGSKPALVAPARSSSNGGPRGALDQRDDADTPLIDMSGLAGILEYDPREYTLTALAGTRVADVQQALAEHGQTLPFDPPFAERGATLGGTVAAGVSGPGRHRNGGVRDFILGVSFVDGQARVVRGGGKVVKNAAGFDLPKLFVGSLGKLGLLVEMTFKVFPRSDAYGTLRRPVTTLDEGLDLLEQLSRSSWDLAALDMVMGATGEAHLDVRLGGLAPALAERLEALRASVGGGDVLNGDGDADVWRSAREFTAIGPGSLLVKVPLTPGRIAAVERALPAARGMRRYFSGGQVAWLEWTAGARALDDWLCTLGLAGLIVLAPSSVPSPLVGATGDNPFGERVKRAMDPDNRFG